MEKKIKNNLFNLWKKNIKGMPVWKNIKQGSQNNNDDNKSNNMYLEHDDWGKLRDLIGNWLRSHIQQKLALTSLPPGNTWLRAASGQGLSVC